MEHILTHSTKRLFRPSVIKYLYNQCPHRYYKTGIRRKYSCLRYNQPFVPSKLALSIEREIPNAAALTSVRDFCAAGRVLLTINYDENDRALLRQDTGPLVYVSLQQHRNISLSAVLSKVAEGEKSKVEQTVEALKEAPPKPVVVPVKKSLWQRFKEECVHYYHGFKLLGIDMKVATKLGIRMAKGNTLTRREHQLLIRTVSDVFRLVPFSVFIFVPLAEFALPIALKLFPGMLPSTFQTKDERMQKLKTQLKVKLEVAKFLQDTLDQMSLQTSGEKNSQSAQEFKEFFMRIRESGDTPSTQEILKFSKLFKDDLTLDNLPRGHLLALCRMLELHAYGPTTFLTFQLRMTLRNLKTDDRMIQKEGVDNLTTWELQQALKARGIRAIGYTEAEMKQHLSNWLDLSLKQDIPPSLLLLTRAMSITDVLPGVDQLAATLKELPDTLGAQAEAALGEMEGKVDNKIRLKLIKEEEKRIAEEQKEQEEMAKEAIAEKALTLEDPAVIIKQEGITSEDLEKIEGALESMAAEKKKLLLEKEELEDLKAEVAEYQEDLEELKEHKEKTGMSAKELQESKAAQRLYKQINKIIVKMDDVIDKTEADKQGLEEKVNIGEAPKEELVSINELVAAMRRLQKTPDNERMKKIENVIAGMDVDQDGNISMDDVVKVFELLGHESSNVTPDQMKEIVEMLKKEEALSMEEKLEKLVENTNLPEQK